MVCSSLTDFLTWTLIRGVIRDISLEVLHFLTFNAEFLLWLAPYFLRKGAYTVCTWVSRCLVNMVE